MADDIYSVVDDGHCNIMVFCLCALCRQDRPSTSEKIALAERIIKAFPVLADNSTPNGYVCRFIMLLLLRTLVNLTRTSGVAERPHDSLSVVSFIDCVFYY